MSEWPSTRAKVVLAALLRIGWQVERQTGSHQCSFDRVGSMWS